MWVQSWEGDSWEQDLRDDCPALQRHSVRFQQLSKLLSCHVSTFQLGFLGVICRVNSRSRRRIPRTFWALVRPSSRNFPPSLLVHVVLSSFHRRRAGALSDMQDRVPVTSVDGTRAHSVVCERHAISSGFGGGRCWVNSSKSSARSGGKDTHPEKHMSLTQPAIQASPAHFVTSQPDGFSEVELVSRTTYIGRKRRNLETRRRQSKAAEREAKRKLMAQPEIGHEAAEQTLRS